MLADLVDHVIGVDPAKRVFTAVVVDSRTAGEQACAEFKTTPAGYAAAVQWADAHTRKGRRAWAIEGTGSYGSGLTQALSSDQEWVIEFGHPKKLAAKDGAKSDRLDAARAGRETLGLTKLAQPRARGEREALRCLLVTRNGALKARTQAINSMKNMIVSAPVQLRVELDTLTTAELIARCARFRHSNRVDVETASVKLALQTMARRVQQLSVEADDLEKAMRPLVESLAPQLLEQFGVNTITASQVVVAWSHKGRFNSAASFCRLAAVAPIQATTGGADVMRHRLSYYGDRDLNKALHTIAVVRIAQHPETKAFMAQKRAEGKSRREARRILKRYIARQLFRLLENPPN